MSKNDSPQQQTYTLKSIGTIHADESKGEFYVEVFEPYRPAMKHLADFSHAIIIWWGDQCDDEEGRGVLQTPLPYAEGVEAGVFACRSFCRPNPVLMTTMFMLDVDEDRGIVRLPYIDAYDGTPLLDIKPYIPISDRIRDYEVAPWLEEWPEWMEDAAEFFEKVGNIFGD